MEYNSVYLLSTKEFKSASWVKEGSVQQPSGSFSANPTMGDQNRVLPGYGVPTQNRFAPFNEWVGYSFGIRNDLPQHQQMDWEAAQSKR